MKTNIFAACITLMFALAADAQEVNTGSRKEKKTQTRNNTPMPPWGKAQGYNNDRYIYFPDYYTFYSPERGYTYYQNGNWTSSPNIPAYMAHADLDRARTHILTDVPNNTFPEKDFSSYKDRYPSQSATGATGPVLPLK